MHSPKTVCIVCLLSSLGGCSNRESRYQVFERSIAAYMNPGQSQPTTVLVDSQTAQTWYLLRTDTGKVTWAALGEPVALKK